MTVTTDNIRDLLNRPRGLNEATITELISIRTAQVNKSARNTKFLGDSSVNAVTDAEKNAAIKALVCSDCLQILIDTISTYVDDEGEKRENDIRLTAQMRAFQRRADDLMKMISERGGSAFVFKATKTKVDE